VAEVHVEGNVTVYCDVCVSNSVRENLQCKLMCLSYRIREILMCTVKFV